MNNNKYKSMEIKNRGVCLHGGHVHEQVHASIHASMSEDVHMILFNYLVELAVSRFTSCACNASRACNLRRMA